MDQVYEMSSVKIYDSNGLGSKSSSYEGTSANYKLMNQLAHPKERHDMNHYLDDEQGYQGAEFNNSDNLDSISELHATDGMDGFVKGYRRPTEIVGNWNLSPISSQRNL